MIMTRLLRASAPGLVMLAVLAAWSAPIVAGVKVTLVRWPYT